MKDLLLPPLVRARFVALPLKDRRRIWAGPERRAVPRRDDHEVVLWRDECPRDPPEFGKRVWHGPVRSRPSILQRLVGVFL
jgi:hypothetical protein